MRSARTSLAAVVCAAVLVAGCSSSPKTPPPPPPTQPPQSAKAPWTGPLADYRMEWSTEAGIDLLTGPAVVVRAYLESVAGAIAGGSDDYLYPGFEHFSPRGAPKPAPGWPDAGNAPIRRLVGTDREHILRIQPSGGTVDVVLCEWNYASAEDLGNGQYGLHTQLGPNYDGVLAVWEGLTPPATASPPLPPQRGPEPAPADDVFGGWRITHWLPPAFPGDTKVPPEWPTMVDDINACEDKAPDPLARRLFLTHGSHPRSDFPTLPAFPGWPAGGAQ